MDATQFAQFMKLQKDGLEAMIQKQQLLIESIQQRPNTDKISTAKSEILLPTFDSFDPKKETFRNYRQRFENYIVLKKIVDNKDYCAKLLLHSIGAKNFNIVNALAAPILPGQLKYDELMKLLEDHLAPKKNILVAQHQFLSKYQLTQQSVAEYVAELRANIGDCEFSCTCKASIADFFLRAQFIRGLKDNDIREKLLQAETTVFKNIVDKAIALESAKADSKELAQKASIPPISTDINKIQFKKKQQTRAPQNIQKSKQNHPGTSNQVRTAYKSRPKIDFSQLGIEDLCLRCGRGNHVTKECRTDRDNLKCATCQKRGHVARVCITNLMNQKKQDELSTHHVMHVREYGIYHINEDAFKTGNNERFQTTVNIEGRPIVFEVDSGSGFTFLPRDRFAQLKLDIPLERTDIEFRSYTRDSFMPDGKIKVEIECNGIQTEEEIYIVPEEFSPLLGRSWIRRLKIDLNSIDNATNNFSHHINIVEPNELFSMFPDVFQDKIGCTPQFKVSFQLREKAKPIFHREREVPYALLNRVNQELDNLEKGGIITKSQTSDWGSPLVIIPKPNGELRLCVDYKIGVNERLVDAHYPIRKIDEIINSLNGSRYFCKLDLYKAYLHIPVDDQTAEIQTITTHRGTYKVNRLSFGIKTAPAEFNRIIDQILKDIPKTEYYFDDIIVHGETREECRTNLIKCLERLQKFDLHVNRKKCEFFSQKINFLGHVIEHNRIHKSPEKVEAVNSMKRPGKVDELRTFLGMVTYYSKFIPNHSTMTAPLRQLLKSGIKFKWTAECEQAFLNLKREIVSDRILVPYDATQPIRLACDASPVGIGAVLSHVIGDQERPIAFASRALTPAEQNYSQIDREALAIVFAVEHFFQYLFGRPFVLITDNQPLARIFHQNAKLPSMTAARLQRYAAFLSGFNYKIECKKGVDNTNADCLSRIPMEMNSHIHDEVHQILETNINTISTTELNFQTLKEETAKDSLLKELLQRLKQGTDMELEFFIDRDIIFKGQRVVVPASIQPAVLTELHRTHLGITKMKQLARRYVYWKSIDKDIERLVRACPDCASVRNRPVKAPLHPWEEPDGNWQRIHMDYAGPFQGYHFLIVMDAKSKWAEIIPCHQAPTSNSSIELLQDIFSRNGFPDVLVSDNATIFTSEEFQQYCRKAGIFQKFTAPGHPATNGLAERNVQTLKKRLSAMSSDPSSIREKVREILFRYRATPLSCGKSPSEMYLQRQIRIQLDALRPTRFQKSTAPDTGAARNLSVGDRVQSQYYTNNKKLWKQGVIIKKFGFLHYLVQLDDGYTLKRHIDQLRASDVEPKRSERPLVENNETIDEDDCTGEVPQFNVEDLIDYPMDTSNLEIEDVPMGIDQPAPVIDQQGMHRDAQEATLRIPRNRRPPTYLNDYVCNQIFYDWT